MAGIVVRPRTRIFHGHDWVYASEVLKTFGNPAAGDVISLKDGRDRPLGSAIYNASSQIVARRFSRQRQDLDLDFFIRRIRLAIREREALGASHPVGRVVWSESDGLPGVIVDRYGEHVVLQTLTVAMDLRKPLIVDALKTVLQPASIFERNDAPVRQAEGLPLTTGDLWGESPSDLEAEIGSLKFRVDLRSGHKTGLYLDQADNCRLVAGYAAGKAVLDCFSNQGAFALHCSKAGAIRTVAVEANAELVARIRLNAAQNRLAVDAVEANVFDYLTAAVDRQEEFDLIILDPPSFTKTRGSLENAWRGYKEIHRRALQLLRPHGMLATFSCSHHVTRVMFLEMIVDASVDAKRFVRVIRSLSQPLDHPILPHLPETEYLKGFLLQLLPGR
ncbi:MAG: class I SAM-dependent rRNA methyltransferase [Verrucomicrobia bacterium]|nr:class I SAM-dependent rRNA methyltransferase [Verrucomicrobiota bacterium]